MSRDPLDYPWLVQDTLRGVVRRVLEVLADQGPLRGHFFYITFVTRAPGVALAPELMDQYPEEMTIILKQSFWDLEVGPDEFSVRLSFSSVPHTLTVPYSAVVAFVDPPAEFGLRFAPPPGFEREEPRDAGEGPAAGERGPAPPAEPAPAPAPEEQGEAEKPAASKVVSLDDFRKK